MQTETHNPPKFINLSTVNSIWEHLRTENEIQYFWLGRQPYQPIWNLQKQLHAKRVSGEISDIVLMLEHDHVYTFGKNADPNYLLDSNPKNAEVIQIDRGGEVTYHGPGQLVCYPIIDLHNYQMSVSWYMRMLESVIIHCMKEFGIESKLKDGVWASISNMWDVREPIRSIQLDTVRVLLRLDPLEGLVAQGPIVVDGVNAHAPRTVVRREQKPVRVVRLDVGRAVAHRHGPDRRQRTRRPIDTQTLIRLVLPETDEHQRLVRGGRHRPRRSVRRNIRFLRQLPGIRIKILTKSNALIPHLKQLCLQRGCFGLELYRELPIETRTKITTLIFTINHQSQRRRLHPTNRFSARNCTALKKQRA